MLKVGDRVRYIGPWEMMRGVTGTVTKLYEGYDDVFDGKGNYVTSKRMPYPKQWSASVRVDKKPDGWPYPHNDKFAPDVTDLERI